MALSSLSHIPIDDDSWRRTTLGQNNKSLWGPRDPGAVHKSFFEHCQPFPETCYYYLLTTICTNSHDLYNKSKMWGPSTWGERVLPDIAFAYEMERKVPPWSSSLALLFGFASSSPGSGLQTTAWRIWSWNNNLKHSSDYFECTLAIINLRRAVSWRISSWSKISLDAKQKQLKNWILIPKF